jgi:hypothetical protein
MGGLGHLFPSWGLLLQALAIIHFIRRRPDTFWLFVILMGGVLGAVIYIVVEVVPDANLLRGQMQHFSKRRRMRELEATILENSAVGNIEELADLCLEEGKFARARQLYDKVLSAQPGALDPSYRRALAALATKDHQTAVSDLERVIAQDPKYDFNRAIGLLAHANALVGRADRADMLFETAVEVSTLAETYFNYATFLHTQGRKDEAREWAQRILTAKLSLPRHLQRRDRPWYRKAKALLRKLPT